MNPWSRDRTWGQRSADYDVGDHPHRLEVRGTPRTVTWPDVCANCGGPAAERIRVRRAFYRRRFGSGRSLGWFGYQVVSADIPFCGACAARHRETVPKVSWLRRYGWFVFNPAHIATIGFAVLLTSILPDAGDLTADSGRAGWGLAGLFVAGMIWTVGVTWWMTRPHRFEPRSEITAACTVSHNVAQIFEGRRHIYGFRNQTFAEAFERANAARVWTERDQARMWKMSTILAILLVVVLLVARLLQWHFEGR